MHKPHFQLKHLSEVRREKIPSDQTPKPEYNPGVEI
jgi:hypothetical protein